MELNKETALKLYEVTLEVCYKGKCDELDKNGEKIPPEAFIDFVDCTIEAHSLAEIGDFFTVERVKELVSYTVRPQNVRVLEIKDVIIEKTVLKGWQLVEGMFVKY